MQSFDAVLFDWSGTLVHDPRPDTRLAWALDLVHRDLPPADRQELSAKLASAEIHPEVVAAMRDEDTSSARHRAANMLWFGHAGLDTDLAEALYSFDDDPDNRPLYFDVISTLSSLRALDVKVAVVSDIHLDIRVLLARQGAAEVGIATLILPPAPGVVGVRGLDVVTRMVGASSLA
jgi:FMN phosphatase YigB (HAD superfamily)